MKQAVNTVWPKKKKGYANILSYIGFVLVILSPVILYAVYQIYEQNHAHLSQLGGAIFVYSNFLMFLGGAILCVIALCFFKSLTIICRALSIAAIVIANPFSLYIYLLFCTITYSTLANLPWM